MCYLIKYLLLAYKRITAIINHCARVILTGEIVRAEEA